MFKDCVILGEGKAYLGRAWRAFSRVIIANSKLSDIVVPQGWNAWFNVGYEQEIQSLENIDVPGTVICLHLSFIIYIMLLDIYRIIPYKIF